MSSSKVRDHRDDDANEEYPSSKRVRTSRIDDISRDSPSRRCQSLLFESNEEKSVTSDSLHASDDGNDPSKKRSRSFVRPVIRSAVPHSQVLALARRPSQSGSVGQRIDLYTNHFRVDFSSDVNDKLVYQFDVDVEILMRDGSWRSARKDERFEVMEKIIVRESFPLVWYDEGKNLYAVENLTLKLNKEYRCDIVHKKTGQTNQFRFLLLNLVKTYELKTMFDFIQRKIDVRPHDPVRILETLFKQTQRLEMITINNQSYPRHQRLDDLGDGRGLASGFYQAIVLGQSGLTLNMNNTFCCFYQHYNLVEFLSCFIGQDIRQHGISTKDFPLLVRKLLKPLWLVTNHTNQVRRYRVKSFGLPANEHRFTRDQGGEITVAGYFQEKWKIPLRHPHLPVVELFNPADKSKSHHLPMELVTVDEWQRSLKPLTTEQRAKVTKKTVVRPGERYGMIRRVADERRFNDDSFLTRMGIRVDNKEMLLVKGRVLPSPEVKYKSGNGDQRDVIERVNIGKWWLNHRFNQPKNVDRWAVILISEREPDHRQIRLATDFAQRLPQGMAKYGIRLQGSPIEKSDAAVPQTILARMNELKSQGCEVIFYILNQVPDDIYHAIKFFGNVKLGQ